jgi:hypothetical protein
MTYAKLQYVNRFVYAHRNGRYIFILDMLLTILTWRATFALKTIEGSK